MATDVQEYGTLQGTYSFSTGYFTPYATPTDVVGLIGSANRVIRILRLTMSCTQTTAGINQWFLLFRSTADTGGTPTAVNAIPHDLSNATATLTINQYTAAPSVGTLVNTTGRIKGISVSALAPAASSATAETFLYDDQYRGQPLTLRTAAQGIYLNFAGAAVPAGLSICVSGVWREF